MNLIKSISNYYKKNIGMLSPKYLFNSNSNSNIKKFNNMDKESIKNVKRENNSPFNYNNVSNNIINNNTFNTTLNIYKMNLHTTCFVRLFSYTSDSSKPLYTDHMYKQYLDPLLKNHRRPYNHHNYTHNDTI